MRFIAIFTLLCLAGCATIPPMPPINLQEPGWTARRGQAVWGFKRGSPDISGELTVATHTDGRAFVEFTKTPIPFLVAQSSTNTWEINFVPERRRYSGRGRPPTRLIWLHLPGHLLGAAPSKPWLWQRLEGNNWRLENSATGESLEGYLDQ